MLTKNPTGFLYGASFSAITCSDIINYALASKNVPDFVDVFIFDVNGRVNKTYLTHYSTTFSQKFDNYTNFADLSEHDIYGMISSDIVKVEDVTVLNRKWRIIVIARAGYIDSQRTAFPNTLIGIAMIEPAFAILFHGMVMTIRKLFPEHAHVAPKA
ncbi:hypothetical protein HDU99_010455 [Rhizoclosmatium hyalinum]|nr:hypothetical protein HDU99_010455 [Rhizoclosmatium hyalinum]